MYTLAPNGALLYIDLTGWDKLELHSSKCAQLCRVCVWHMTSIWKVYIYSSALSYIWYPVCGIYIGCWPVYRRLLA